MGNNSIMLVSTFLFLCASFGHGYIILDDSVTDTSTDTRDANAINRMQDSMSYVGRPRFSSPNKDKRTTTTSDLSDDYLEIRDSLNDELNDKGYILVRDTTSAKDENQDSSNSEGEERKQTEMAGQHRLNWRFFNNKFGKRQQQHYRVPNAYQHARFGGQVRDAEINQRQVPVGYRVLYRARIGGGSGRRSMPFGGIHRPRFHSSETNEKKETASMKNYRIVAVLEDEA